MLLANTCALAKPIYNWQLATWLQLQAEAETLRARQQSKPWRVGALGWEVGGGGTRGEHRKRWRLCKGQENWLQAYTHLRSIAP